MMNGRMIFLGPSISAIKENTILDCREIIRLTHSKSRIEFRPHPWTTPKGDNLISPSQESNSIGGRRWLK
jgi:hypothetical protein